MPLPKTFPAYVQLRHIPRRVQLWWTLASAADCSKPTLYLHSAAAAKALATLYHGLDTAHADPRASSAAACTSSIGWRLHTKLIGSKRQQFAWHPHKGQDTCCGQSCRSSRCCAAAGRPQTCRQACCEWRNAPCRHGKRALLMQRTAARRVQSGTPRTGHWQWSCSAAYTTVSSMMVSTHLSDICGRCSSSKPSPM